MAGRWLVRALIAVIALLLVSMPGSTLAGTSAGKIPSGRFERCASPSRVLCRSIAVPLDHSGARAGTVRPH